MEAATNNHVIAGPPSRIIMYLLARVDYARFLEFLCMTFCFTAISTEYPVYYTYCIWLTESCWLLLLLLLIEKSRYFISNLAKFGCFWQEIELLGLITMFVSVLLAKGMNGFRCTGRGSQKHYWRSAWTSFYPTKKISFLHVLLSMMTTGASSIRVC